MDVPPFVEVAADPTLIGGIYDACDQWCMYCHATQCCLAYRCGAASRSTNGDMYRELADRLYEGIIFLKQLSNAEGRATPEIDVMLANDPRANDRLVIIDDPIEKIGRRYARVSDAYLRSRSDFPFETRFHPSGPLPLEIIAWYHRLVPAKIYRALVSAAAAARGEEARHNDALISAKVALLGIDRSREAVAAMAVEDKDPRLDELQAQLRRLRTEVEKRFPAARRLVRPGLDIPLEELPLESDLVNAKAGT